MVASAKRRRLGIRLQVAMAAGALSFGLEAAGEEVRRRRELRQVKRRS
jgi:hypothetical protein